MASKFLLVVALVTLLNSSRGDDEACSDPPKVLKGRKGVIESPGYQDGHYPDSVECRWRIKGIQGYGIRLSFKDFDLDAEDQCATTALKIGDVYRICGRAKPRDIYIENGGPLDITFNSDYVSNGRGFRIEFEHTKTNTICAKNQFMCDNRRCISKKKLCDGIDDCRDASDETDKKCKPRVLKAAEKFECGVAAVEPNLNGLSARIVGGSAAVPGAWPWMAAYHRTHVEPVFHSCGGALIHPQFVISAAHCFEGNTDPSEFKLVFGRYNKFNESDTEQVRYIENYVMYEEIGPEDRAHGQAFDMEHDIVLIKLNAPVHITDTVRPVCLPDEGEELPVGTNCYNVGWGETRGSGSAALLKQLLMIVQPGTRCHKMVQDHGDEYNPDSMICTLSGQDGSSPCSGDSGGPLLYKKDGRWYVHGVVSFGEGNQLAPLCGMGKEVPDIFNRVSTKIGWIRKHMKYL